jgi:hypothetical protein
MISERAADKAAWLMSEFAMKTGLSKTKEKQRRYLWTDAFAVCNFLELFERTGDEQYRRRATELIDQVHRCLGGIAMTISEVAGLADSTSKLEAFIQRPAA